LGVNNCFVFFKAFVKKRETDKAYDEFRVFRPLRSYSIYMGGNIIVECYNYRNKVLIQYNQEYLDYIYIYIYILLGTFLFVPLISLLFEDIKSPQFIVLIPFSHSVSETQFQLQSFFPRF